MRERLADAPGRRRIGAIVRLAVLLADDARRIHERLARQVHKHRVVPVHGGLCSKEKAPAKDSSRMYGLVVKREAGQRDQSAEALVTWIRNLCWRRAEETGES